MKYLFWNTNKNTSINNILKDIIISYEVSLVILAEYCDDSRELLSQLYSDGKIMKEFPTVGCERITVLGSDIIAMEPGLQADHYSIQIIDNDIILCCVHLNSKIYSGDRDYREILIQNIVTDIQKTETELNTRKSVVVGDFNINPYEKECINARYFHGIPYYLEAKKDSRKVAGKYFYMFYNPMWNFLGDFNEPYGTFFHNSGKAENTYWNIYDQVIIRPSLRKNFVDSSLTIISKVKDVSLLDKKGHPDDKFSDHLPIVFEIKED